MKKLLTLLLAFSILFGCKKETTTTTTGTSTTIFPAGGYIRGTINGQRTDGTAFSINFNNQYCYGSDEFDEGVLVLERIPSGNISGKGYVNLELDYFGNNMTYPPVLSYYDFDVYQALTNGQTLNFRDYGYVTDYYFNATVTNYRYDATTRIASGTFSIQIDASESSTGYPVAIVGEFQSNAVETIVHRMSN